MAEGGGGGRRTSNHISDLENSADKKIFCSLSVFASNYLKGQPCVGKTDVLLD